MTWIYWILLSLLQRLMSQIVLYSTFPKQRDIALMEHRYWAEILLMVISRIDSTVLHLKRSVEVQFELQMDSQLVAF